MVCNITHISYNIQLCDSVCFLACEMFIQNKIDKMERIWRKCNLDIYTPLTTRLRLYSNMSHTCVRIYMYQIVMCIHCQPLLSLLGCETETAIETGRYRSRSIVGCSQPRELKYGTRNMIWTSVLRCDNVFLPLSLCGESNSRVQAETPKHGLTSVLTGLLTTSTAFSQAL